MNPVIFELGPIVVRWYGVMMALTILTSIVFATRWGPRFGIDRAFIDRLTFWLAIVLFPGARLARRPALPRRHRRRPALRVPPGASRRRVVLVARRYDCLGHTARQHLRPLRQLHERGTLRRPDHAPLGHHLPHRTGCAAPSSPVVRDDSRGDRPGHRVAGRPAARLSGAGVVDDCRPDLDRAHLPGRAAQ